MDVIDARVWHVNALAWCLDGGIKTPFVHQQPKKFVFIIRHFFMVRPLTGVSSFTLCISELHPLSEYVLPSSTSSRYLSIRQLKLALSCSLLLVGHKYDSAVDQILLLYKRNEVLGNISYYELKWFISLIVLIIV